MKLTVWFSTAAICCLESHFSIRHNVAIFKKTKQSCNPFSRPTTFYCIAFCCTVDFCSKTCNANWFSFFTIQIFPGFHRIRHQAFLDLCLFFALTSNRSKESSFGFKIFHTQLKHYCHDGNANTDPMMMEEIAERAKTMSSWSPLWVAATSALGTAGGFTMFR